MNIDSKILICYNEPAKFYNNYIGKIFSDNNEDVDLSETEFSKQLGIVQSALNMHFTNVSLFALNGNIKQNIDSIVAFSPDIIFNFVESLEGNANYESYIAGIFDLLGIHYTGNSSLCLGNCLIKSRTKQILKAKGIRTPEYTVVNYKKKIDEEIFNLKFPVILKLLKEDASIGISEYSVVKDLQSLKKQLRFLFDNYKQDVLIEEYIIGRELNVSILKDEALPISEITFKGLPKGLPKIVTYEAKWSPKSIYYKHTIPQCPAIFDEGLSNKIISIAVDAFKAMDCRDYARVDIRLNKRSVPYVIEVNPNPDISTDSGFARSAKAAGISYDELLCRIVNFALNRKKYDSKIVGKGQAAS